MKKNKKHSDRDTEEIDKLFERIWEGNSTNLMIAIGLYIPQHISLNTYNGNIHFPCIFICPERVIDWADKLNIPTRLIFLKVYYHELGHAFIHNPRRDYNLGYHRLLEKSYCNAIAISRFKQKKKRFRK